MPIPQASLNFPSLQKIRASTWQGELVKPMVSGIGYLYNQGFGGFVLLEKHGIFFFLNLYCRAILNFECWSSQVKPMSRLHYPCLIHIKKKSINVYFFPVRGLDGSVCTVVHYWLYLFYIYEASVIHISVLLPALLEPCTCSSDQLISPYSSLDETSLIFI